MFGQTKQRVITTAILLSFGATSVVPQTAFAATPSRSATQPQKPAQGTKPGTATSGTQNQSGNTQGKSTQSNTKTPASPINTKCGEEKGCSDNANKSGPGIRGTLAKVWGALEDSAPQIVGGVATGVLGTLLSRAQNKMKKGPDTASYNNLLQDAQARNSANSPDLYQKQFEQTQSRLDAMRDSLRTRADTVATQAAQQNLSRLTDSQRAWGDGAAAVMAANKEASRIANNLNTATNPNSASSRAVWPANATTSRDTATNPNSAFSHNVWPANSTTGTGHIDKLNKSDTATAYPQTPGVLGTRDIGGVAYVSGDSLNKTANHNGTLLAGGFGTPTDTHLTNGFGTPTTKPSRHEFGTYADTEKQGTREMGTPMNRQTKYGDSNATTNTRGGSVILPSSSTTAGNTHPNNTGNTYSVGDIAKHYPTGNTIERIGNDPDFKQAVEQNGLSAIRLGDTDIRAKQAYQTAISEQKLDWSSVLDAPPLPYDAESLGLPKGDWRVLGGTFLIDVQWLAHTQNNEIIFRESDFLRQAKQETGRDWTLQRIRTSKKAKMPDIVLGSWRDLGRKKGTKSKYLVDASLF